MQYLQVVEGDLGNSAKTLRLAKMDLEEKKAQTEERKKTYDQLKESLNEKKKDYEATNNVGRRKLHLLNSSKA